MSYVELLFFFACVSLSLGPYRYQDRVSPRGTSFLCFILMLYRFYKAQVFAQHVKKRLLWMTLLNGNEWCFWTWMMTELTRILGHVNVVLHWPTMTEHGGWIETSSSSPCSALDGSIVVQIMDLNCQELFTRRGSALLDGWMDMEEKEEQQFRIRGWLWN